MVVNYILNLLIVQGIVPKDRTYDTPAQLHCACYWNIPAPDPVSEPVCLDPVCPNFGLSELCFWVVYELFLGIVTA